jgi:hypothetical protein
MQDDGNVESPSARVRSSSAVEARRNQNACDACRGRKIKVPVPTPKRPRQPAEQYQADGTDLLSSVGIRSARHGVLDVRF